MEDKSEYISKAKSLIASVSGKPMTIEERSEKAIELAGLMLNEARRIQTNQEKKVQAQLARMMDDEVGKAFTTQMTDQCYRSSSSARIANQLKYVIQRLGIPKFLNFDRKVGLKAFEWFGTLFPNLFVPLTKMMLRKETSQVILPGEPEKLAAHMHKRHQEGVRINLNHLGEAILGEEDAKRRLQIYLEDLSKPEVEYISVKISTICSQLNLLAWEDTVEILASRLKRLYRAANQNYYQRPDGTRIPKFVNLDMEEYRDLLLTVDLFKKVLDDPEFFHQSAGIVLQSYLPDSYLIQQELTVWAMQRVAKGGAPIKIRIVKGANLAMEQVESALKEWPQAPYDKKSDVDANYKRMVAYGCKPEHAQAACLGIASHNLFDIANGLLLRSENNIEKHVCFEMLEGMADHMRRVVQELAGDMLLYCPAATKEEFQNAVAYLVRRLDENTAPENFLRQAFGLQPGTAEWNHQAALFQNACENYNNVSFMPRRSQNRNFPPKKPDLQSSFENEADTDWALTQNRKWAEGIVGEWARKKFDTIPLQIGGEWVQTQKHAQAENPNNPKQPLYQYSLADKSQIDKALNVAIEAQKAWGAKWIEERSSILADVAQEMRLQRGNLIGVMLADTAKTVYEADVEISEAIDFAEYYRRNIEEVSSLEDLEWSPKGVVLVTPPWNFPCSIPAGGILAALAAGNSVIFKPAPESVLVGWELAQIFWRAGVCKEVLQFITCEDEPVGSELIKDPRVAAVVLTGATSTAKIFLKMRPGLDLLAETGGKNAMIVSGLSDRDLAIKDLIQSAFGHAGQKCSACSLAILEAEVYDDQHFMDQLRDAAASLRVSTPWDMATKINPLIREANPTLLRGLTQLDEGEEWLLKPKQDPHNPNLWSPGIKLGVKEGSYSHQTEFFGPVLSIIRADNLEHAIRIANGTQYGLTSGLQSLDPREQARWIEKIEAGNCYINRGITGAVVQRQPFGGCKESSFGRGSKAGGCNYLMQLMHARQVSLPKNIEKPDSALVAMGKMLESNEDKMLWEASLGSYTLFMKNYFNKRHDPSLIQGQDNYLIYKPHKGMTLRVQNADKLVDILRVLAACMIAGVPLDVSAEGTPAERLKGIVHPKIRIINESEKAFIDRIAQGEVKRVRLIGKPSNALQEALGKAASNVLREPVLANGRVELLNYLREMSLSIDYHRYGNLGEREHEQRAPLKHPGTNGHGVVKAAAEACGPKCCCH